MSVMVAHVMTSKVVFAAPGHTVDHVRELMASKRIHALPVADLNSKLLGIVTSGDVARRIDGTREVREVMNDTVCIVRATAPVSEAAVRMRKNRVHHLVVTDNGRAVGIVSAFDLLSVLANAAKKAPEARPPNP